MKDQLATYADSKVGAIAAMLHVPVIIVQVAILLAMLAADASGISTAGPLEQALGGTLVVGLFTGNISWLTALVRKSILKPTMAEATLPAAEIAAGVASVVPEAAADIAAAAVSAITKLG